MCVCVCVLRWGERKTNGDEQDRTEGKKLEKGVTRMVEGAEGRRKGV